LEEATCASIPAIAQLRKKQKTVKPGDLVEYVYVDNDHVNPMNRVAPAQSAETYDTDKYAEMLLDVAETALGVFGFSRTQLGVQHKSRSSLDKLQ